MSRIRRNLAVALAVAIVALVPTLSALAAPLTAVETANFGWFQEANGQGGAGNLGFAVTNEAGSGWWDAYRRLGREQAVGFPASRRFNFDGFQVQVFQKLVFQRNEQFGGLAFLNVFDILSQRGQDDWLDVVRSIPQPFNNADEQGMTFEQVRAKRLAMLDINPAIKAVYNNVSDPVTQYGLPVSFKDYGNVFVVRAQRAAFQQWKEDVPWARRGTVTIVNGGDIFKEVQGLVPQEAATPEPAPAGSPTTAAPAPTAPAAAAPAPGGVRYPGVGFGMQINPGNDLARGLAMTTGAGFNWVRIQLRWEDLEGSPGAINWGVIDNVINASANANTRLMLATVAAPAWARKNDDRNFPGPPADPQTLANFLGAIAARHKGKVAAYQIWNEPNLFQEWGGCSRMNAGEYAEMLRRSYNAVKAADPDTQIIVAAPSPAGNVSDGCGVRAIDDVEWTQQLYAAGIKNFFDAYGVHGNAFNNPPDDWIDRNTTGTTNFKGHGSFYFRRYEQIRAVMVANGDQNKQIWVTEFGWASSPNPHPVYAYARDVSEAQQAQYLVRAFELGRAAGYIGPMFVWNLNFATGEPQEDAQAKRAFAILRDDWSPRPAYDALARMPK